MSVETARAPAPCNGEQTGGHKGNKHQTTFTLQKVRVVDTSGETRWMHTSCYSRHLKEQARACTQCTCVLLFSIVFAVCCASAALYVS